MGVEISCAEMLQPYRVVDRNLVTGQNPLSAAILGKRMLEILAEKSAKRPTRGVAPTARPNPRA